LAVVFSGGFMEFGTGPFSPMRRGAASGVWFISPRMGFYLAALLFGQAIW
jgi:hypothetical protein